MSIAIRYFSKSGNVKKLAEAMGGALQIKAESVDAPLREPVDLLFLGAAIYAGGVDKRVNAFIQNLDPSKAKVVVVFSSAARFDSVRDIIKNNLEEKGITVANATYHCKGSFLFMNRGKPDASDLDQAARFAQQTASTLGG